MKKGQFYISFNEKGNTAAVKAIEDCRRLLALEGYNDYSITVRRDAGKMYLLQVLGRLAAFYLKLERNAKVIIQYPLLSGNKTFKYFIKALRLKKVQVFCLVHDLDELRSPEKAETGQEAKNLNAYDCIIVHNDTMANWLKNQGVETPMVSLGIFDYLPEKKLAKNKPASHFARKIAFAGNLVKSGFIYDLDKISEWSFNIYGPNFLAAKGYGIENIHWYGSYSAGRILEKIEGAFGLIWDGDHIQALDDNCGAYLRYNNPHKLSLYIAAGLPVIVPRESAMADFVTKNKLGILIDSLLDLNTITVDDNEYQLYKNNVAGVSRKVREGNYLKKALAEVEAKLNEVTTGESPAIAEKKNLFTVLNS